MGILDPPPYSRAQVDARTQTLGAPNTRTDDYTLALGDAGRCVEVSAATAKTVTVPAHSAVPFAIGTVIEVCRFGPGAVTIAPAGGVTLRSRDGRLSIGGQYGSVSLRKRQADEWVVVGDLA